jgi:hypothetical protein
MPLPDAFAPDTIQGLLARLEALKSDTRPQWGKMDVAQMCAHCCTPYEQLRGGKGGGPWILKVLARAFFKGGIVGEAPFRRNLPTPKTFRVADPRDFERERARLRNFISSCHGEGRAAFDGRGHVTFGPLTATEWSNLLYKHLDHHLRQFGA